MKVTYRCYFLLVSSKDFKRSRIDKYGFLSTLDLDQLIIDFTEQRARLNFNGKV